MRERGKRERKDNGRERGGGEERRREKEKGEKERITTKVIIKNISSSLHQSASSYNHIPITALSASFP